jgi:hypothetical protein
MYLFPIGLMLVGLWLLLRNFERIPQLAIERLAGFMLLYICILAGIHFFEMYATGQDAMPLAEAGGGGGYIGALIAGMLETVLGSAARPSPGGAVPRGPGAFVRYHRDGDGPGCKNSTCACWIGRRPD